MTSEFLLLFLGTSILISLICSQGATLIRSPLIVGYIITGALLGPAVFHLINEQQIVSLNIINTLTLSLIGFGVGGELKIKELKKLGKTIFIIVIFEATITFLLVGICTAIVLKSVSLGMIYGALASATAPAGTVDVIRQYKAKGNLTTTLYAVMGLDDIYALLIFTIATPLAIIFLGGSKTAAEMTVIAALGHAGLEILMAIGIGSVVGFIMVKIVERMHDRVSVLFLSLGIILVNCGLSEALKISPILLNMSAGIVAVNYNTIIAGKIFNVLGNWSPPIYVWFFVLVGTSLDFNLIINYAFLIIIYIIARSLGKWSGAFIGAKIGKAPEKTKKYLGLTLLSQAGVAIGLALAASNSLEQLGMHHESIQVMSVMTATTFLIMLIGPILARIGLEKAGETHVSK